MTSIDIFPWNQNFETGLPEIDRQHRKLVDLLNTLAAHVALERGMPQFGEILDQLADYTVYHFQSEEAIWKAYFGNDIANVTHQDSHQSFIARVLELKADLGIKSNAQLTEEVLDFLARWLASHILESDRHMAYVVLAMQKGLGFSAACADAKEKMSGTTRALIDIILAIYSTLSSNTLRLMRELSERRKSDREAMHAKALLNEAVENVAIGFTIYDEQDRLVTCNEAYLNFYSTSRDLIVPGATFEEILRKGAERGQYKIATGQIDEWVAERVRQHQSADGRMVEQLLDDGSWILIIEHRTPSGFIVGNRIDITERKKAEAELFQYRDHLESLVKARTAELQSAKIQAEAASRAKSVFLANMSHELRTPLNAIMGMNAIAIRQASDPTLRDQLGKIEQASKHLLNVINDILDISKIEAERLELEATEFQLHDVLDKLDGLVRQHALNKGLSFTIQLAESLRPLHLVSDPLRLGQVLLNLVGNAVKFTAQGSVILQIDLLSRSANQIFVRVEVRDTGPGISKEDQSRLFNAFVQADNSTTRRYGGSGLGLAISKQLVELMGGTIGVESDKGQGCTFWFELPFELVFEPNKAGRETQPSKSVEDFEAEIQQHMAGKKVLLVEDEPINLEIATILLEDLGLIVEAATNGEEAVHKVLAGHFDLVLMDMQMPVMDGLEATRKIRQSGNHILPIVAMTANAFVEDRNRCIEAGMNEFISKPVSPEVLYGAIMACVPV